MATKKRSSDDEQGTEDLHEQTTYGAKAEATDPEEKAPGDLSQDELDEKLIKELKEKVACATDTNPQIKLSPTEATRLLALAGHPLGEE